MHYYNEYPCNANVAELFMGKKKHSNHRSSAVANTASSNGHHTSNPVKTLSNPLFCGISKLMVRVGMLPTFVQQFCVKLLQPLILVGILVAISISSVVWLLACFLFLGILFTVYTVFLNVNRDDSSRSFKVTPLEDDSAQSDSNASTVVYDEDKVMLSLKKLIALKSIPAAEPMKVDDEVASESSDSSESLSASSHSSNSDKGSHVPSSKVVSHAPAPALKKSSATLWLDSSTPKTVSRATVLKSVSTDSTKVNSQVTPSSTSRYRKDSSGPPSKGTGRAQVLKPRIIANVNRQLDSSSDSSSHSSTSSDDDSHVLQSKIIKRAPVSNKKVALVKLSDSSSDDSKSTYDSDNDSNYDSFSRTTMLVPQNNKQSLVRSKGNGNQSSKRVASLPNKSLKSK